MASPRGQTAVKATKDARARETYQTRLVNVLANGMGRGNWVVEWFAAILFFEIWVLLRLGCVSRARTDGIEGEHPARPTGSRGTSIDTSKSIRRFHTYIRYSSKRELAQLPTMSLRLHEILLESRRSTVRLLEPRLSKVKDIDDVLNGTLFASKLLYKTENVIAQQSFSRVETVKVKGGLFRSFHRRVQAFDPDAVSGFFPRRKLFALKSYTGVRKYPENSGTLDPLGFYQAQINGFFLEAYVLLSLDHPNIIKVADVFIIDDLPCIVLELCQGGSLLDDVMQWGVMDGIRSRVVLEQLCNAVAYLHSLDIVHGDIKLENVMFKDVGSAGSLKLVDFGSVEIQGSDAAGQSDNVTTCFGGTLPYQAPEILSGSQSHPTKASECWSVGILMYVLLAGEFPFSGDTAEEILLSIHQDGHAVVDSISTDPSLERLIKRLLQIPPID